MPELTSLLKTIAAEARATGATVLENEPMSAHTTFHIGGPADLFIAPPTEDALEHVVQLCRQHEVPLFPLGNGSNLLVSDAGIRGVVLHVAALNSITIQDSNIVCGAGAKLSDVCIAAQQHGLTGLEFAYGIPGSAGGAAFMNAGAYGGEMKDVVLRTEHLGREGRGSLCGDALEYGYRHSAYSCGGRVITGMTLRLTPGNGDAVLAKMQELLQRRRDKQPLELPSAGSVFKRPTGYYAGTLIDSCGLKGRRVGGAMVSEKHAGFIVNAGGATCEDVCRLIEQIQQTVLERTGVSLECEVKVVGG